MGIMVAARLIMTAILARNGCEARLLGSKTAVRGGFGVRWCGSIGHLANVSFPASGWYELGSPEGEPVKPQERDELAKHQKLEAINARLAQHDRKVQVTLLLAVILNVVILAPLAYLRLGRN
jgi:hypothetical protein